MRLFPSSRTALSLIGVAALAAVVATPLRAERSPFTDLPADHWAYPAVRRLVEKGILSGYPDGSFRGSNLVSRYALAVSLAKAMEGDFGTGGGSGNSKMKLTVEDLETLEALIKEFGDELALVGVKTAAAEEQLAAHARKIEDLDTRVAVLESGETEQAGKVRFDGGRFRAFGYNKSSLNGGTDFILNVGMEVNEDVGAHVSLRYQNIFDQVDNESFGTYEAYLHSKSSVGPIDQVRIGKMNNFLGNGLTLFDRREGIEVTASREDLQFELSYFDALMAHVSTDVLGGGRLGFYWIKQDRVANRRPQHIGVYARGETDGGISYGAEFTEYDNDGATLTNRDQSTQSIYFGLGYTPKANPNVKLRAHVLTQEEDFRGLAVDSDLRWQFKDGRVSPHHDLLQAIRDVTPAGVDPDEIPGFRNIQLGVDFKLPDTKWSGWVNFDILRGHTRALNHSADDMQIYTVAVERTFGSGLDAQLRWQGIEFENANGLAFVAGIPALRRQNTSNLRAQVVKRF